MAKKLKTAHRDLVEALDHHSKVMQEKPLSSKRAGRATAKLRLAVSAYSAVVAGKTGQPDPFVDYDALDPATVASLAAERDAIAHKKSSDQGTLD
ncbi:hypothetical protein [Frigoribacterium sp. VKM Ac-2836]|uniref:hypothetical protein n=1 Tax=Frigoribacterium sp. VKM Ac-2836 TaxID=2739014 RepID=UPI0015633AB8|nr:hypothetical protein [Frigoribacterium sp. VKM Ac-2836]NRD25108.1 hypothetical protein [Frigoribacterium sp. VKM Ac-2836]